MLAIFLITAGIAFVSFGAGFGGILLVVDEIVAGVTGILAGIALAVAS